MYSFKLYFLCFCFFITTNLFAAESIFSKAGNIYYENNQITDSGKDHYPILSSNKKIIAFIRSSDVLIPDSCEITNSTDEKHADEIWIYDIETKKERLLVSNNLLCDEPEKSIIAIESLQFSPDNKLIYFLTSAWATSNALHVVNVDSSNQHYLLPAQSFEIVPKGKYQGYLIVQQHRYFIGGGSFDWFWLLTKDGKEAGPIGEEVTDEQRKFFEREY